MNYLISIIALLMIMAATAMPFTPLAYYTPFTGFALWRYIFTLGAIAFFITRLIAGNQFTELRLKRLQRMQFWAGVMFCVASFFIFYEPNTNDWIAFTLAGALLQAYSTFVISRNISRQS